VVAASVVLSLGEPAVNDNAALAAPMRRACELRIESTQHYVLPFQHLGHTEATSEIIRLPETSIVITGSPGRLHSAGTINLINSV
jgi:hypothetical protein